MLPLRTCPGACRLAQVGFDEAASAKVEDTIKQEQAEVRRCKQKVDELSSKVSGARKLPCSSAITFDQPGQVLHIACSSDQMLSHSPRSAVDCGDVAALGNAVSR